MKRSLAAVLTVLAAASAAQAVVVTVPNSAGVTGSPWLAFMNVTNLDGSPVFGSVWGVPDVRCTFNDAAPSVTLLPNTINDPNPFWYTPAGGPGSTGNKIMEGNVYIEQTDVHNGTTLTFQGVVLARTLTNAHAARIFIRDFAPDYSSFNETVIGATPGPFSISLACDPGAGRHVQYGFQMTGPCVWVTDVEPFGSVVFGPSPVAPTCNDIDFNGDGLFPDDSDLVDFLTVLAGGACTTGTCDGIDFNNDGLFPDDSDLIAFLRVLAGGSCNG